MVNITDDMDKVMHASDRRYQSDFFFVCVMTNRLLHLFILHAKYEITNELNHGLSVTPVSVSNVHSQNEIFLENSIVHQTFARKYEQLSYIFITCVEI